MVDDRGGSEYHLWLIKDAEEVELYKWVGYMFVISGGVDGLLYEWESARGKVAFFTIRGSDVTLQL